MRENAGLKDIKGCLRTAYLRGEALLYRLPCPLYPAGKRRPGQTTVEYLLMLAVVAGMAAMMAVLFHKRILGGIFTLVGLIIGAGAPK